jgi:hypothetical protein
VAAEGSTIDADGGPAGGVDAGGEAGDAAIEDAGEDGDTASTPDESAALRPWTDPLLHPTTTIPIATAHAATRRVAFT